LPALMQDAQALSRFLLPPGRATTCTVWTLGSHRRLVRRWECDTDLPKPGPFPQISHTAAMSKLLKSPAWGPATRVSGAGTAQIDTGPVKDTDSRGEPPKRPLATGHVTSVLSPALDRLIGPVRPAGVWFRAGGQRSGGEIRWRPPEGWRGGGGSHWALRIVCWTRPPCGTGRTPPSAT